MKNNYFFLLVLLILFGTQGKSQINVVIGAGSNSGTTANGATTDAGPMYNTGATSSFVYSKHHYVFTSAELSANGLLPNVLLTKIAWRKANNAAYTSTSAAIFDIYLKNSTSTGVPATVPQPFSNIISGATQAYASTTQSFPIDTGWIEFNFPVPFLYTGGALEVTTNWDISAGGSSASGSTGNFAWYKDPNINTLSHAAGTQSADFTFLRTSRAQTRFTYIFNSPCVAPPTAGTTLTNSNLVCAGGTVNLSLSGTSIGSGLSYQWQSGPSATGPWTNLLNDTNFTNTEVVTAPTYYQCIVTCSGQSSTSTPVFVGVNPNLPAGTYTIGPAGNYTSFGAAVAALSCGIAGPVTFNVLPNSGPYNEQITIPSILNSSSLNTVTFNCNNNTLSFAPTATDRHILRLNGADYVTFNDLNIIGTDLTNGFGILLNNNSDYNSFVNVIVDLTATFANTGTGNAGIVVSGSNTSATTAGTGGTNNSFIGCTVKGGYYGITILGASATSTSLNNLVSNCIFEDFYFYGIYVSNISNSQILNNQMRRPNRTVVSSFYGISHLTGGVNNLFESNRIYNGFGAVAVTNTSTTYGLYSTADATVGNENKYYNNLIYDINNNGTAYGIYNLGSDNVKYYHNTISLDHAASTAGITRGFFQTTAASGIDFRNNIISITRGGTGVKHCVYMGTTTSTINFNNNNYYINSPAGTNSIGFFSANQTTLANWQSVNGGIYDLNSTTIDPMYVFPVTGNFAPSNMAVNSLGTPLGITTDILGNLRDASFPDMGAFEFGTSAPVLCTGIPTAGTAASSLSNICSGNPISTNLSVSGYTLMPGITFQWQQSSSMGGPYTDVIAGTGATSPNYISAPIASTTYFVCKVTCTGSNLFSLTNEIVVNAVNPALTSTQGASLCGVGSVALNAVPSGGAAVNWYASASGGTSLATGNTFNTPILSNTTTYYAAASSGGLSGATIPGDGNWNHFTTTGSFQSTAIASAYMILTVIQPITLNTMDIYPSAALGTAFGIEARTGSATGAAFATYSGNTTVVNTGTPTVAQTLPVNWSLPAGTYYIGFTSNPATWRSGLATHTFPWTLPGVVSLDFYLTPSYQYYFYNLTLSTGCEGARVPVIATISNAPSINGSSNISSICSGNNATLSVTSTNANYTYSWSPGGQTGSSITVNPSSTINYIVTASDNSTGTFAGCTNLDTVSINVQPTLIGIDATPEEHCLTGSSALVLNPSVGYSAGSIEWQTSINNSTFTTIAGASVANYTTPTLTASTYFKAIIKDANGITCNEMVDSVMVNNPQLISTTAGESCGPNSVLLSANSGLGTTVNWYTSPTGGAPFNTGNTFNTPLIFNSTTYYAAAATIGAGPQYTGLAAPTSAFTSGAGTTNFGLVFDVLAPFTLNTVTIYPISATSASGTVTIDVINGAGAVLHTVTVPVVGNPVATAYLNPQVVTLNFNLLPGTNYKMRPGFTGITGLLFGPSAAAPVGGNYGYPFVIPGILSINTSTLTAAPTNTPRPDLYYYFFNWEIIFGCESARVPVDASILDLPIVNLGNDTTFCDNISVNLDAGNFVSYAWSTGANSQNISVNTSGTYSVTVTDTNACTNTDTIVVTANPTPNPSLSDVSNCTGQAETLNPGVSPAGNTFNWSNGQSTPTISVTSSGTYIVTVTNDGSGCSGIDTAVVNINTAQAIGLNNAIVCDYNSITLTVPSSFTGVTWSTGATGNSVTIAGSSLPVGANNITINAIDANGCATTQTIVLTVDRCLSVSERANSNSIKVYPNPSSGKINVETENISNAVLEVIDLNGRVLLTQKLGNDVKLHNVDLTGASSGMYFLKITGDGFQNVERITIR